MSHIERVSAHLERLRTDELALVRNYFKSGMSVLEIGGGSGWQAKQISKLNCEVHSIDLPNRLNLSKFFNVVDYDGRIIPFAPESFDIVFSSNVLEHVSDINNILSELRRVLKKNGLAVLVMPTPSWRFWTIVSHFPYLLGASIKHLMFRNIPSSGDCNKITIIPPPHGEYKSSFHEIYYYSRCRWGRAFRANSLNMIDCYPTGVFCTGYALFPNIGIGVRKKLARVFGSAGNVYIVTKNDRVFGARS